MRKLIHRKLNLLAQEFEDRKSGTRLCAIIHYTFCMERIIIVEELECRYFNYIAYTIHHLQLYHFEQLFSVNHELQTQLFGSGKSQFF